MFEDSHAQHGRPMNNYQQRLRIPSKKLNINQKPFQRDIFQSSSESEMPPESEYEDYGQISEQKIIDSLAGEKLQSLDEFT